ncbi:delta-12 fatty acid desaturase protein [Rutstroemia sp. NJR-2017a BVV2]|nr:delta-12 fatty acid desaturase protein [Rutstroemia sp. NJR-2017a BVV2]
MALKQSLLVGQDYSSMIFSASTIALLYSQQIFGSITRLSLLLTASPPDVPEYEPEAWTFLEGALATTDNKL